MYQFNDHVFNSLSWGAFKEALITKPETENNPHIPEERGEWFTSTATQSFEIDYLDLVYGLIRAEKPRSILETGTFYGLSCIAIAYAVKENYQNGCQSEFTTLETDPIRSKYASYAIDRLNLANFVQIINAHSLEYLSATKDVYDFILFDSSRIDRVKEYSQLVERNKIGNNAILLFHDTSRFRKMSKLETDDAHECYLNFLSRVSISCAEKVTFPKSRGLSLFRFNQC